MATLSDRVTLAEYVVATPPLSSPDMRVIHAIIDGQEMWVPDVLGNNQRELLSLWEQEGHEISPAAPEA